MNRKGELQEGAPNLPIKPQLGSVCPLPAPRGLHFLLGSRRQQHLAHSCLHCPKREINMGHVAGVGGSEWRLRCPSLAARSEGSAWCWGSPLHDSPVESSTLSCARLSSPPTLPPWQQLLQLSSPNLAFSPGVWGRCSRT